MGSHRIERRRLLAPLAPWAIAAAAVPRAARAQDAWPSRPVTIVVPQATGGANDTVARAFAQRLAAALGQPVVIENRTGAGGNVGTAAVARAPRDGHTLLLTAQSAQTINPALYRTPGFDPVRDFEPVMTVATAPYLLVAHRDFPPNTLRELIEYARARPGRIDYASAGNGTLNHLLGVMLNRQAKLHLVHIPYRGAAAAATDVVGQQVQMTFGSFPGLMPFVKTGQLKVLGVATERRTRLAPELPTLAETLPGLAVNSWYGLFAPAGTPRAVVDRLAAEGAKVLADPALVDRLATQGAEPAFGAPAELARLLRDDLRQWAEIVRASGATID